MAVSRSKTYSPPAGIGFRHRGIIRMQRRDAGLLHKGRHAGDLGRIQQGPVPQSTSAGPARYPARQPVMA